MHSAPDMILKTLADPTRRTIFERLPRDGEQTVRGAAVDAETSGCLDRQPVLDRIAPITHYRFYVLVLSMVGTGFATAILAGLSRSVFQGSGAAALPSFAIYPTFVAHFYLALLLVGLVVLHAVAALYHQFALKDRLFRRVWFGRRIAERAAASQ